MTKNLKWRLGKLPTSDEVLKLVNDKIITKEEAREILFNEEIIDKLANKTQIIETIKYIQPSYNTWTWTAPYVNYCSGLTDCTTSYASLTGLGTGVISLSDTG